MWLSLCASVYIFFPPKCKHLSHTQMTSTNASALQNELYKLINSQSIIRMSEKKCLHVRRDKTIVREREKERQRETESE